ncbi:MAG: hypothetical protein AMJ62_06115 [Myxococcales bacterium SG8_38]|nr:MAG: hypothetical protein AMJ62_06115 [Myxococcales bacterium SG8_38]
MQVNGLQPLGLQTPGMHVDGLHDACACALFRVIVARTAGAVYAAAFRKCRRAVYPESAPRFQLTGATIAARR